MTLLWLPLLPTTVQRNVFPFLCDVGLDLFNSSYTISKNLHLILNQTFSTMMSCFCIGAVLLSRPYQKKTSGWEHICPDVQLPIPNTLMGLQSDIPDCPFSLRSRGHSIHDLGKIISGREKMVAFLDGVHIWPLICMMEL